MNWAWLFGGVFLMFLELLTPGFIIFFFGLAAMSVGIALFIFEDLSLTWQFVFFSVLSILYIMLLRKYMKRLFVGEVEEGVMNFDSPIIGRTGIVTIAIKPPLSGRVIIGDAEWNARSKTELQVGETVRVVEYDNLTLSVESVQ